MDIGSDMSSDVDSDADLDPGKFLTSDSDSDTDTRFLLTSDTDSDSDMDSDKVMTSDMDTTSDTGMSENLGHGHTSDPHVRSSLAQNVEILSELEKQFCKQFWSNRICV